MMMFEHLVNLAWEDFATPERMDRAFLARLDLALEQARVETLITSDYRPGDPGAHGEGLAVDFSCDNSRVRFRLVKALLDAGFTRIGIYPTHIHVDCSKSRDQEVIWYAPEKDV